MIDPYKMTNLPTSFVERMQNQCGPEWPAFQNVLQEKPPISIRFNTQKQKPLFEALSPIPWIETGYYLEQERPKFSLDPLFHAGCYYVQEASSMILSIFMQQILAQNQHKALKILDLCAAPGGKTTLIQSLMSSKDLLVANEVIKSRSNILEENVMKWGTANCIVTNNDPSTFQKLNHTFDIVLVDAPCSGEGMFRKNPKAITEWSEDNVSLCAARQKRILAAAVDSLKPGGTLIYSTCTYNDLENRDNLDWLMQTFSFSPFKLDTSVGLLKQWGIHTLTHPTTALQLYPHRLRGEGLFITALQKEGAFVSTTTSKKSKRKNRTKTNVLPTPPKALLPQLHELTQFPDPFHFFMVQDSIYAIAQNHFSELSSFFATLKVRNVGVHVATIKGKNCLPAHHLAMTPYLHPQIPRIELDLATALQYLRGHPLAISADYPKNWVIVSYLNQPLGWVKVLNNRVNNYYPKYWRIRT